MAPACGAWADEADRPRRLRQPEGGVADAGGGPYTSPLFRRRREYAERSGAVWFIVSAKHGLVDPDRVVAPYDITLRDISAAERAAFGMRVIRDLAHEAGPLQRVVVEVHAGRVYVEALRAPLRKVGARLHWPVKGLGIGRQLQWYDSHVPRMRRPGAVRD